MIGGVLLHGDGALVWAVTYGQRDLLSGSFLDQLGRLVRGIACNHLTADL